MEEDTKVTICRVCINEIEVSDKCFSVFEKYEDLLAPGSEQDNILIADKIVAVAKVGIEDGDGLPTTVCSNCLLELEDTYNFKLKCEKSDNILRLAINHKTEDKHALEVQVKEENCEIEQNYSDETEASEQSDDNKSLANLNIENYDISSDEFPFNKQSVKVKKNKSLKFRCDYCNNYLKSECKLRVHLRKEHNIYSCPKCKEQMRTFGALRYHRRDNHCMTSKKNKTIPPIDELKVIPKSDISRENPIENTHQTDKTKMMCEKEMKAYYNRLRPTRSIDLKLECHDCGSLFKSKCKLRVHWKKEHSLALTCQSCKRKFKSYKAYKNHQNVKSVMCRNGSKMRIEDEGGVFVYYCIECDYKTKRRACMKQHFIVHSNNHRFKCNLCPKTYLRNQELKIHKEDAHQLYVFEKKCPICGEFLIGYHKIRYHVEKHRKKSHVQCDICKQTFAQKAYLIYHISKHTGLSRYPCDVCNKLFFSKNLAKCHKKRFHTGPTYCCSVCGYTSRDRYAINKHEKKHSACNVACSECGKFLDNDVQLRLHTERHLHKRHTCEHCQTSFFDRKSLSNHLRNMHKVFLSKSELGKVKKKK